MSPRNYAKGEQSRSRLLSSASAEFAESGYHNAKISNIVERAGLTQAAFYLYFTGKEAIFDELVEQFHDKLRSLITNGGLPDGLSKEDVPGYMRAHLRGIYSLLAQDANLTRLALLESSQGEAIKRELAALLSANLQAEQQAGYLRADFSVALAAEYIVGVVERATVRWLLTGEKSVDEIVDDTAAFIMHGLFKDNA